MSHFGVSPDGVSGADAFANDNASGSTTTGTVVILRPLATLACAGYGYLALNRTLLTVDLGSGSSSSTTNVNVCARMDRNRAHADESLQISSGSLDAIGFSQTENYIYGVNRGIDPQVVYRIGAAGQTQFVASLPSGFDFYAGEYAQPCREAIYERR